MDDRVTNLETTISYQENLLEQLNSVIIDQQKAIDILIKKMNILEKANGFTGDSSDVRDISQEHPPPHY